MNLQTISQPQSLAPLNSQVHRRPQLADFIANLMQEITMQDVTSNPSQNGEYRAFQGPLSEQHTLLKNQLMGELENSDNTNPQKPSFEERVSHVNHEISELESQMANLKSLLKSIPRSTPRRPAPTSSFKCYMRSKISRATERRTYTSRFQQASKPREMPRVTSFEGPRVRLYQQHGLNKINRTSRKIRKDRSPQLLENSDSDN